MCLYLLWRRSWKGGRRRVKGRWRDKRNTTLCWLTLQLKEDFVVHLLLEHDVGEGVQGGHHHVSAGVVWNLLPDKLHQCVCSNMQTTFHCTRAANDNSHIINDLQNHSHVSHSVLLSFSISSPCLLPVLTCVAIKLCIVSMLCVCVCQVGGGVGGVVCTRARSVCVHVWN